MQKGPKLGDRSTRRSAAAFRFSRASRIHSRAYTGNRRYRERLLAGASRYDLDGNPVGTVTTEEAADAREKIAAAEARAAARKESQEGAPQPKRDGLAELRAAAQRRKQEGAAA